MKTSSGSPLFGLLAVTWPALGHAHGMAGESGGFVDSIAHFVSEPAYLLCVVAMALWAGQQGSVHLQHAVSAAMVAPALATVVASSPEVNASRVMTGILVLTALIGVMVALQLACSPWVSLTVASAGGLLLGLHSAAMSARFPLLPGGIVGVAMAIGAALLGFGMVARAASRPWQKVLVRVVGSWIVASALLVLALALRGARADVGPAIGSDQFGGSMAAPLLVLTRNQPAML